MVTANPTARGFDRMERMLAQERQEERSNRVDAAMRRAAMGLAAGGEEAEGQAAPAPPATPAPPEPVIQPAPAGGGQGGGAAVPAAFQAAFDAATGGEGRIPGLRPVLASYVQHESGWRPDAVNPDGNATGLGQIRLSTARDPGFGVGAIPAEARTDPDVSLRFMADYMDRRARSLGLTDLSDPRQMRTLLMHVSDPNAPGHIDRIIAGAGGASGMPASPGAAPAAAAPMAGVRAGANPMRGAIAALAGTPGAGQAALNAAMQGARMHHAAQAQQGRAQVAANRTDQRERFRAEQMAMTALGRGDEVTARYWAQRAGITIPPGVAQNAQARTRLASASLLARRFYQDRGQAMTFFQHYMRSGDALAAAQAAGVPRENPRFQFRWVQQGEQEVLTMLDPTGRQAPRVVEMPGQAPAAASPAGQAPAAAAPPALAGVQAAPQMSRAPWATGGSEAAPTQQAPAGAAPVTRARGQGSQARTPAMETRYQMLLRAGLPEQEAAAIAGGARPTANAVAQAYRAAQRDIQQALDLPREPAARQAEIDRRVEGAMAVFGPGWREMLAGRAAPPAQTEAPAAPPSAPTQPAARAAPPQEHRLRDGTVGRLTGDRTRDGRPIYQTPDGRRFAPNASASTAPRA